MSDQKTIANAQLSSPRNINKIKIFILALILFWLLFIAVFNWIYALKHNNEPEIFQPAPLRLMSVCPPFSFMDSQGNKITQDNLKGKWSVFLSLDMDCPACINEAKAWEKIKTKWGDKVQILGVLKTGAWGGDKQAAFFARKTGITYPCMPDAGGKFIDKTAGPSGTLRYPTLLVFNPKGQLSAVDEGFSSEDSDARHGRWKILLDALQESRTVPSVKKPRHLRPDILASQVTFMNGKRATLGAICKSKIMALTFINPNCKDCQRRLFDLSRMPQSPDMINLAVIVDEIPDKSVNRMLDDKSGIQFVRMDLEPWRRYLTLGGLPDTLLINDGYLIGRDPKDSSVMPSRTPALLQAVLDEQKKIRQKSETPRKGAKTEGCNQCR